MTDSSWQSDPAYLVASLTRHSWPGVLSEYVNCEESGSDKLKFIDIQAPGKTLRLPLSSSCRISAALRRQIRTSRADLLVQADVMPGRAVQSNFCPEPDTGRDKCSQRGR